VISFCFFVFVFIRRIGKWKIFVNTLLFFSIKRRGRRGIVQNLSSLSKFFFIVFVATFFWNNNFFFFFIFFFFIIVVFYTFRYTRNLSLRSPAKLSKSWITLSNNILTSNRLRSTACSFTVTEFNCVNFSKTVLHCSSSSYSKIG
jgi:hypothetical protein